MFLPTSTLVVLCPGPSFILFQEPMIKDVHFSGQQLKRCHLQTIIIYTV